MTFISRLSRLPQACFIPFSRHARPAQAAFRMLLYCSAFCLTAGALAKSGVAHAQADKPAPDVIVFTNGDQLTGAVVRGVDDSIVFKSDMAGEITVPFTKIKELRSASSFAVLRKDTPITKKEVQPGTIHLGDDEIKVSNSVGPVATVPLKQVAYIIDEATYHKELTGHPGFLQGWSGGITAGATIVRSTQNGSTFTAGVALIRAIPDVAYLPKRNRTIFNLAETYGKLTQPTIPQTTPPTPDSIAKTSVFHTDIEQDQYFSQRFYVLAQATFDHNYSQGLNLQEVYGGGIGLTVFQTPIQTLDFKGDIHYEKQYFETAANNENLIGATLSENYLRNLPRKIVFTESASFLPAFNNANAYSANFAAGILFPVYHRFSASFTTTDNYLNNPSAGFKKNSYQFVTGITYSLR